MLLLTTAVVRKTTCQKNLQAHKLALIARYYCVGFPDLVSDKIVSNSDDSQVKSDKSDQPSADASAQKILSELAGDTPQSAKEKASPSEAQLPRILITDQNKSVNDQPARNGQLSIGDQAENSKQQAGDAEVDEQRITWREKEIILRTKDGITTFYRDHEGREWESKDGRRWEEKGTDDSWHGSIRIDSAGNLHKTDTQWGKNKSLRQDGNLVTSFTTRDGKEVKLSEQSSGQRTLHDGARIWQSTDGKNWTSDKQTQRGSINIDEYGRLRKTNGRTEISLSTSAETQNIIRTMWRLESQYNLKFKMPGDTVEYRDDDKTRVPMRLPTAQELKVIEDVLDKFKHLSVSQKKLDFDGFQIGFTAYKGKGKEVNVAGWHDNSPEGVFFGPIALKQAHGFKALEGIALHELSHELQNSLWKENEVPKNILDFFGYEKAPKAEGAAEDEDDSYRIKDKDGNQWQYLLTNKTDADGLWMPVRNGVMSEDRKEGITDREMRSRLPDERKPSSEYFYDPAEAHAEALALYIYDPATLYDSNPNLYWEMKKWDQEDINRHFKTQRDANGSVTPIMIRGSDGRIVLNTEQNRKQVEQREEAMSYIVPSHKPSEAHKEGVCNCSGNRKSATKKKSAVRH